MPALQLSELTAASISGAGVFDVLMRSVNAHLDEQFKQSRIKGPEYATVYLGAVDLAMQTGLQFLLQKRKNDLEAQLLDQQLLLAQQQVLLAESQVEKSAIELAILTASQDKVPAEIAQIEAQTSLLGQQRTNLVSEGLNIPKQGELLDAQVLSVQKQTDVADAEISIKQQQVLVAQAEVEIAEAKLANIPKEGEHLDAQTALSTQQALNLVSEELAIVAKTELTAQQTANSVIEGTVLTAQQCKLSAEFDLIQSQTTKTGGEIDLLAQKTATERSQTQAIGVDADSVVGRQKSLYQAQTSGFQRDAEQKAAKLLADTWSVRRTTDEATSANSTNMLDDTAVGRAIEQLLAGVGA